MRVSLVEKTPNPERVCAKSAHVCYSAEGMDEMNLSNKDVERLVKNCLKSGHVSVFEHASFTFSIEGVSRALSHQLVRHRLASYSQQSQRYVKMGEPSYVMPHSIKDNENEEMAWAYDEFMTLIWNAYNQLVEAGIPPEDARYLLPNACTTNIVVTMNCRELLHFFSVRCCNKAQWEIREMAEAMLAICKIDAPLIFTDAGKPCLRGPCPESKPCGKS